jgi:hypothetical protein
MIQVSKTSRATNPARVASKGSKINPVSRLRNPVKVVKAASKVAKARTSLDKSTARFGGPFLSIRFLKPFNRPPARLCAQKIARPVEPEKFLAHISAWRSSLY